MGRAFVIGGGIAGLSAAHHLQQKGMEVSVFEAAQHAGGRCRTFYDSDLDADIDNGTHLILSGNHTVLELADESALFFSERARFPFFDLEAETEWAIDLGKKSVPWMFESAPGVDLWKLMSDLRKLKCDRPMAEVLDTSLVRWRTLWAPLTLAITNTQPSEANARLMHTVLSETMLRGGAQCRPVLSRRGLSPALVDPMVKTLDVRFGEVLGAIETEVGRATRLNFKGHDLELAGGDVVVLAVSWGQAAELLAGRVPAAPRHNPIINVHFKLAVARAEPEIRGLVGGLSHWISFRDNLMSVTISAANDLVDLGGEEIARRVWAEVGPLAGGGDLIAPYRVIKEKRATFAETPEADAARPESKTDLDNLVLAGDWVQTGFPATLEGAARSGKRAAELLAG